MGVTDFHGDVPVKLVFMECLEAAEGFSDQVGKVQVGKLGITRQ